MEDVELMKKLKGITEKRQDAMEGLFAPAKSAFAAMVDAGLVQSSLPLGRAVARVEEQEQALHDVIMVNGPARVFGLLLGKIEAREKVVQAKEDAAINDLKEALKGT